VIGVDCDDATTRRPSGGAVTESRWLIQPICSGGRLTNSSPPRRELGLAELGDARPLDAPAELLRHDLHAVADAERRDPELEDARIDLRRALRVDEAGPPERTSASGFRARISCG
jgi:hypothetical protein